MIKYKIVLENQTIEFANEADALAYKEANNLVQNVESFEEVIIISTYVPESVTPRQIRQALILSGVSLEDIENALNSLPEPIKTLAKIEWEYSTEFQRSRDLVKAVQQVLQWTDKQVDDLWILADSL